MYPKNVSGCSPGRRCAPASPMKRIRNGCGSCAIALTSTCVSRNVRLALTVPIELRPARARPLIAVTCGEPAGIGPELCGALTQRDLPASLVLVGDRSLIETRAQELGIEWNSPDFEPRAGKAISIYHVPLVARAEPGKLDVRNSPY